MMTLSEIEGLSETEKTELILSLWREVQILRARNEELEAKLKELEEKLNRPAKDCRSLQPPPVTNRESQQSGRRPLIRRTGDEKGGVGRAGGGRRPTPNPDQFVVAKVRCCPHCRETIPEAAQAVQAVYDKIELPPVKPMVSARHPIWRLLSPLS